MTHRSSNQEGARLKCPSHTGATQKILDALEREPMLSVYKLQLATGLDSEMIRKLLNQLMQRTGGVVGLPGPKSMVYCLYRHAPTKSREPKTPGPYAMAGRITIPQYRYGSTRLG